MIYYVACLESYKRHSSNAESSYGYLTRFTRSYRIIIVVEEFHDHQFRLKVSPVEIFAVSERMLHFSGSVCRIQLKLRPFVMNYLSQRIQFECLGITQRLTDADTFLHGRITVIYSVFFRERDKFHQERRHCYSDSRMDTVNGIPLQFGNAVADTNHTHSEFTSPQKVCESCHEPTVYGDHFLEDILFRAARRLE